jgi:hypothetical protein
MSSKSNRRRTILLTNIDPNDVDFEVVDENEKLSSKDKPNDNLNASARNRRLSRAPNDK